MTEVIARPADAPEGAAKRYDVPQTAAIMQGYAATVIDRVFTDLAAPRPAQQPGAEVIALFGAADTGAEFITTLLRHIAANADRLLTSRTDQPGKPSGLEGAWADVMGELEGNCTADVDEAFSCAISTARVYGSARVFISMFGGA